MARGDERHFAREKTVSKSCRRSRHSFFAPNAFGKLHIIIIIIIAVVQHLSASYEYTHAPHLLATMANTVGMQIMMQ
ncbi:ATPase P [Anopheles sinensis]|uniref:ATPase P n=1 Tax=Anopheles sinensis TaxID=74873 RepID=A0A084WJ67_ANOSI|nr:ATPase P [Anopheles sinensis]